MTLQGNAQLIRGADEANERQSPGVLEAIRAVRPCWT